MENKPLSDNKTLNIEEVGLEDLQNKYVLLEQQVEELTAKLKWYEEQFRLGKQRQFGASSEKTNVEQKSLFDEAEVEADLNAKEPEIAEITYKRRKQKGKTNKMMEDLPVEIVEYKLLDGEKECPKCSEPLHEMSKEVRKELVVIPAEVKVVEHVRYIYACRNCENNADNSPIINAPMPAPVLPGSFVSPSLMAFIMNRKYGEALPLYRQEQQFKHYGLEISRQTMANWMIHGANLLQPIYDQMHKHLLNQDILHADESSLQVLQEKGRTASNKSFMWLYATGHTDIPIYLYDYRTTRARKHPINMLKDFKGFLHADGYSGYDDIPGVEIVGCWAHYPRNIIIREELLKAT